MKKFIQASTFAQFAAGKVSMVTQTASITMLITLTFGIPIAEAAIIMVTAAGLSIAIVYLSGWARKEYEYQTHLNDLLPRLERIEAKIDKAARANERIPNEHIFDRRD